MRTGRSLCALRLLHPPSASTALGSAVRSTPLCRRSRRAGSRRRSTTKLVPSSSTASAGERHMMVRAALPCDRSITVSYTNRDCEFSLSRVSVSGSVSVQSTPRRQYGAAQDRGEASRRRAYALSPRIAFCFIRAPYSLALWAEQRAHLSATSLDHFGHYCGTIASTHGDYSRGLTFCCGAQCLTLGWRSGIPSCGSTRSRASGST